MRVEFAPFDSIATRLNSPASHLLRFSQTTTLPPFYCFITLSLQPNLHFACVLHFVPPMTTFDVFCTLATIEEREAELAEAAKKASITDPIAMTRAISNSTGSTSNTTSNSMANSPSTPGDSAKGAKLFQVSILSIQAAVMIAGSSEVNNVF